MRVKWNDFSKGLWVLGGKDQTMPGFIRRAKGMHSVRQQNIRVRNGSTETVFLAVNPSLRPLNAILVAGGGAVIATPTAVYNGASLSGTPLYSGTVYDRPKVSIAPFDEGLSTFTGTFISIPQDAFTVLQRRIDGSNLRSWGITKPSSGPTLADGGAGALAAGTYQYKVTFFNSATGTESNPHDATPSITIGANRQINLTNIPTSADSQVDERRIYRTSAGGSLFFRLTTIFNNTTTSLTDNSTSLFSDLIRFDNDPPESSYRYHWWSHTTNRMWWCNDIRAGGGASNRVYYSPAGRPEAVQGFVNIGGTDHAIVGLEWRSKNWIAGHEGWWRIDNQTEPFFAEFLSDVPGLHLSGRDTVVATPYGIFYRSSDENFYMLNGQQAVLVGVELIEALSKFRSYTSTAGGDLEGMQPSQWKTAHFFRNELFISDGGYQSQSIDTTGTETIAYHIPSKTWRTVGYGIKAFDHDTQDTLYATLNGSLIRFESPDSIPQPNTFSTLTDNGIGIPFEWELGGALGDISQNATLQRVYLDINTRGVQVTVRLIFEDDETNIRDYSPISTSTRQMVEFNVGKQCRIFSIRLSGTANNIVELFGVEADVYLPGGEPSQGRG